MEDKQMHNKQRATCNLKSKQNAIRKKQQIH